MLCRATRNGEELRGIVSAIHSTGRLTVKLPVWERQGAISWTRTTITSLQSLQILSRERVLFLRDDR